MSAETVTGLRFDAAALDSLLGDWQQRLASRPRALPDELSPCRIGAGPHRHRCSRWHAELVEGYRLARHVDAQRLEAASLGYAAEAEDYRRDHPPVTFTRWLRQLRAT